VLETPAGRCRIELRTGDAESSVREVRGEEGSTHGWFASRYQYREAALGLVVADRCQLPVRRVTTIELISRGDSTE
jgi:transposase-like protein